MDVQTALDLLTFVIEEDHYHEHYDRTVQVADWAFKINTGYDQKDLVTRYKSRESEDEKAQRVRLYNPLTPLAANQIKALFRKLRRTDGVKMSMTHPSADQLQTIKAALGVYYADQHLKEWLFDRLEFLTFFDPNAFLVTEQEIQVDEAGTVTVQPYPVEFYSHQVREYHVENGRLEYVITEQTRQEKINGKDVTLSDFYLYAAGVSAKYKEIGEDDAFEEGDNTQGVVITVKGKSRYFQTTWWVNELEECPGIRAGAYMDPSTQGATYITPLHLAEWVFADLVRNKSYLDLTVTLHTFLQKYAYGPDCEHVDPVSNERCLGGWIGGDENRICGKCHGTGVDLHTTEQETVILKLPQQKENFIPLQDLTFYVQLPEWMPKWMSEQLEVIIKRCFVSVFTTEVYDQATVAQTATEKLLNWEMVYDTLQAYGELYSRQYMKHSRLVAQYLGLFADFIVTHAFPPDHRMESAGEIIGMYERANAASMSFPVLDIIQKNLLGKLYRNNTEEVDRITAFRNFMPFRDKSPEVLTFILSSRDERDFDRVLFENFSKIEYELRFETDDTFHKLTFPEQREKIREKVEELIKAMPEKKAPGLPFFQTVEEEPGEE